MKGNSVERDVNDFSVRLEILERGSTKKRGFEAVVKRAQALAPDIVAGFDFQRINGIFLLANKVDLGYSGLVFPIIEIWAQGGH